MAPTTGGATTLALVSVSAVLAIAAALYWRQRRATAFVARKRAAKSRLPPTIIISLARLPVARKGALKRADEAGLERVSIFDAVDGRTLSTKELDHRQVSVYSGWRLGSSGFRFFDRELKWHELGNSACRSPRKNCAIRYGREALLMVLPCCPAAHTARLLCIRQARMRLIDGKTGD